MEKRTNKRFAATAFLNAPVHLYPLPPFFGKPVDGKLIDLSAGGMAILIGEILPQKTKLNLSLTFPDQSRVETLVEVKRIIPKGKKYLHGIEFLNISSLVANKIERMSTDYIDCESRIHSKKMEVCHADCAFYTMCLKAEKKELIFSPEVALEIAFQTLESPR